MKSQPDTLNQKRGQGPANQRSLLGTLYIPKVISHERYTHGVPLHAAAAAHANLAPRLSLTHADSISPLRPLVRSETRITPPPPSRHILMRFNPTSRPFCPTCKPLGTGLRLPTPPALVILVIKVRRGLWAGH